MDNQAKDLGLNWMERNQPVVFCFLFFKWIKCEGVKGALGSSIWHLCVDEQGVSPKQRKLLLIV